ncbi:MAG: chorismate mutase [Actinomycetota bacterium]|nr:chorismate mutase [Actinomycetota bacterium]
MGINAIRGAITARKNERAEIISSTVELLSAIMKKNRLVGDELIFILFTATEDLTAEFPAAAVREIGLDDVPVICARELSIENSLPRTIRLLMLVNAESVKEELVHVYLREAKKLRHDLTGKDVG